MFVFVFGCGSVLGMALLSGLAGAPLSRITQDGAVGRSLTAASGVLSFGIGLVLASPIIGRFLAS
jgi:hypothetical protein